jgi:ABC-type glycerol-3-phosphate transport system substrate-binding protein
MGAVVVALSAGCRSREANRATEIVYWTGWSGHELQIQRQLIDEFNRTHPEIHVDLLSQFGDSGYRRGRDSRCDVHGLGR